VVVGCVLLAGCFATAPTNPASSSQPLSAASGAEPSAAAAAAGGTSGQMGAPGALSARAGESPADKALQLEALLGQHSVLAADLMRGRIRNDDDFGQAANVAVTRNTDDLTAMVGSLFGDQATLFAVAAACVRVSAVIMLDDVDRGVSGATQQLILDALIRLAMTGPTIIVTTTDRIPVMEADVVLDLTPTEGSAMWQFDRNAPLPGPVIGELGPGISGSAAIQPAPDEAPTTVLPPVPDQPDGPPDEPEPPSAPSDESRQDQP